MEKPLIIGTEAHTIAITETSQEILGNLPEKNFKAVKSFTVAYDENGALYIADRFGEVLSITLKL